MHKNYAKFYQSRIRINNPLNMTKEIIKQAFKELINELIKEPTKAKETPKEKPRPKLLTVSEVAKHHRVTSRTVRNWIHQGKIKFTSPSTGNYRIPSEHLNNIR
jgi:excisionase family DNA binding protein